MLIREGQNTREAALRRYFAKPPEESSATGLIIMIIIGGLLLLLGTLRVTGGDDSNLMFALLLTGAILAGIGWVQLSTNRSQYQAALKALEPTPSDREVQAWFDQSFERLVAHSCQALGLDQAERGFSDPLVIHTPVLSPQAGVDTRDLLWKKGDDQILRFGIYRINIIRSTERHLASYSCYYDFIRDISVHEHTDEFHFCDVLSFLTRETSDTEGANSRSLRTGQKRTWTQEFVVSRKWGWP
jgi:hypothetical protein